MTNNVRLTWSVISLIFGLAQLIDNLIATTTTTINIMSSILSRFSIFKTFLHARWFHQVSFEDTMTCGMKIYFKAIFPILLRSVVTWALLPLYPLEGGGGERESNLADVEHPLWGFLGGSPPPFKKKWKFLVKIENYCMSVRLQKNSLPLHFWRSLVHKTHIQHFIFKVRNSIHLCTLTE